LPPQKTVWSKIAYIRSGTDNLANQLFRAAGHHIHESGKEGQRLCMLVVKLTVSLKMFRSSTYYGQFATFLELSMELKSKCWCWWW